MGLADEVERSARAVSGAACAIAHVLGMRGTVGATDGNHSVRTVAEEAERDVSVRREMEALCISVRAVIDEAAPVLALLRDDALVVRGGESDARVRNGFGSLCAILVTLFDHAVVACLDVSAARARVLPGGQGALERLRTHHGQLRALYGILHLAAKIVALADVTDTLFVDVPHATPVVVPTASTAASTSNAASTAKPPVAHPPATPLPASFLPEALAVPVPPRVAVNEEMDPRKWRAAIKMDDFYGRWFGFHYAPHMRNVLRIVNIARGSVDQAVADAKESSTLIKNATMLGWGWVYTNMVLINNLGVNIVGASKIGADNGVLPTVESVRTFMNLVEDPLIAGVTNLASADTAIDRAFPIPVPPVFETPAALEVALAGFDSVPDKVDYGLLLTAFQSVTSPVQARLMSFKKRPFSVEGLVAAGATAPHTPQSSPQLSSDRTDIADFTDADMAPILQAGRSAAQGGIGHDSRAGLQVAIDSDDTGKSRDTNPYEFGNGVNNSNGTANASKSLLGTNLSKPNRSPLAASLAGVAESSYLASALKSEFNKLSSNVSSLLGLTAAEPAKSLILHFHGGGFVSQSSLGHSVYVKEWCSDMNEAVVLSIDYKLAPENRFPIALHECVYAYLWAIENAAALGTRAERVVLVGDSAGGNLALATTLFLRDAGLRTPDGVCLAYPSLYLSKAWSPSRLLSFFDPLLPLSVMELCMASYLDEEQQCRASTDPYISPVVASPQQLRDLPPVVAVVGSLDPLLDDTALLTHRLRKVGRTADVIRIYDAMPHGFLNMIQVSEQARNATAFLARHMASFLQIPFRREAAPAPPATHVPSAPSDTPKQNRPSASTPALHLT